MAKVKPPTTRKSKSPTTKAKPPRKPREWEPLSLPGIDVRLYQAINYDEDGDLCIPHGVPPIDPNYVFREDLVRELAWAVWPHDNPKPWACKSWTPCLITGPKGSGKTSLVMQLAARCNIPVWRVNMNIGTSVRHLKGRIGAEAGRTVFVPGIATAAAESGGWLLLDEFAAISPPVAMALFPILEPEGAVLLEDAQPPRYVRRHPEFRIFATDNALGASQESTRFSYAGTNSDMNEALLDRFGSFIDCPYMDQATEKLCISSKVPNLDHDHLTGILRVAEGVRQSREVSGGFSTRMLLDWARRIAAGQVNTRGKPIDVGDDDSHVLQAAYGAFLRRQKSSVERDTLIEIIRRMFVISEG